MNKTTTKYVAVAGQDGGKMRKGQRIRLSGGKILTYLGIAEGGSWKGLEKWNDPRDRGIPMYVEPGFVDEAVAAGRIKLVPARKSICRQNFD